MLISSFLLLFIVFTLSCVVGWCLIWGVTPALHTPLMAVTNALSGVVAIAAIIILGDLTNDVGDVNFWLAFTALVLATINIVGGFAIAERMLAMFKPKSKES